MSDKKNKKEVKALEKELKELEEKIESLEGEKAELFDKLQRVSADYANFQKRAPKQIAEAIAYEKEIIVKSLLPAMDNFEHTLEKAGSAESIEAVLKGVQIIYDQMLDMLKSHNAEKINALGEKFDPNLHQAIMQKEDVRKEDGIVLEVFQAGYKLNGRVIRPAKVIVNKLSEQQSNEETEENTEGQ
ncbi:MAG: nucleotide exchange factor GrpE [Sedimentisphaerales bacterium]|nr:nucleotide exchange factor GrpE [Sedimentisphaerales bacterium]